MPTGMERLTSNDTASARPLSGQEETPLSPTDPAPSDRLRAQAEALLPQDDGVQQEYRVYKRRWFGLIQLILLNIIVSWDWLTFAAVSTTSSQYFGVSQGVINWLSTGFLFAFVAISPAVIWTLNKGGPKPAIIAASVFTLVGNWIRYAGARATGGHFGLVMFGQIIIGFAQPFVLSAPTPPPTPPSASSSQTKTPLKDTYKALKGNASFYLILVPFSVYVGFFNAASSLLNQIFEPYGFSETDAGIAGALLIVVGLVTSAVVSPLIDRTKQYILSIKMLVPIIAIMIMQDISPETGVPQSIINSYL
ncbi:MAG: hypothetical protein Q9165_000537 [Trypethelium subeluteriae]